MIKNNSYKFSLLLVFLLPLFLSAQTRNIPAPAQEGSILLLGGVAHIGNGQVIQNAAVAFEKGKLTLVADATTIRINQSEYDQVVDINGKHVYPGFIIPSTTLGLVEVGSINDTRDFSEQGQFNPNVRSIVAYNTDSEVISTMRFNGILMAQSTPTGGVVSGSSSIVQLDAWNWEDAAYKTDDGIHLYWPTKTFGPRWWLGETEPRKNQNYDRIVGEIRDFFVDAAAYGETANPKSTNLKLEAMKGLLDGSKTLYIHSGRAKAMINSIKLAQENGVKKIVVVGAGEALLIKDFLKENNIAIVLADIHRRPSRDHEDTVLPYKLPGLLHEAGLQFCFSYSGLTSARNLPFTAGTSVAHGLPYEEAIKAITSNTANILGIGDRVGTLETGKDATLFVSTGDALDMRTNNMEHIFIQGRTIQLEGRQQFLYKKYSKKYGHSE